MDNPDRMARTMRIDIHPDFLGESLTRKKAETHIMPKADDTSFLARKWKKFKRSPDYEKLLQSIYDGVLVADAKGRIIDFNSRAADFFLCNETELYGRRVIDLISGANDGLLESIRKNLEQHRYTLIEAQCVRRDNSIFAAEIAVNRINLDDESQLCFFVRDVTVRRRAQEALEEAVDRLEEHDKARSQFVSNVSHELRTPLTSMIYAVDNMLRGVIGPVPNVVRRYLKLLNGDCHRLLATVNDILDMRKIESRTLALSKVRIPFSRFARRSVDSLRVQAEQKGLALETACPATDVFVECDAHKMERVIINVVGNAIKFTPEGGRIDVFVRQHAEQPGWTQLGVEDTGIGIPPEAIDRVTERYFTVGEQTSGTGLGLSISKEIIDLHGGALSVKSPPPGREKGTGVYASLPSAEPPRLLIVDDEKGVLNLLVKQTTARGYRVITADNGIEALESVKRNCPDLVLLDLVMPVMDGAKVILKLKSEKSTMGIPVIVITGAHISRASAEILRNFSIPALRKPWQEPDLLDSLEEAFLGAAAFNKRARIESKTENETATESEPEEDRI
ncbi:MAG: ATP-binding protein [Verrucomicrobiota bacterium]|nr:ATP-binding protein [Verrucomicrobiota bacterium]